MAKPPQAPPSSDIDGVHEDEARNTDAASALGQDQKDLKLAAEENAARPDFAKEESRDDRTA